MGSGVKSSSPGARQASGASSSAPEIPGHHVMTIAPARRATVSDTLLLSLEAANGCARHRQTDAGGLNQQGSNWDPA